MAVWVDATGSSNNNGKPELIRAALGTGSVLAGAGPGAGGPQRLLMVNLDKDVDLRLVLHAAPGGRCKNSDRLWEVTNRNKYATAAATRAAFEVDLDELELELIQTHMTQKPLL
jgi:hypothetical protein